MAMEILITSPRVNKLDAIKAGKAISNADDNDIIDQLIQWQTQSKRTALLTLIYIDGNAPYPVGSQMAVCEDGTFVGYLSGGCAERALIEHAKTAIKQNQSSVERYGRNSPYFDIQLPCGSGIDVLIQPAPELKTLLTIANAKRARQASYLRLDTQSTHVQAVNSDNIAVTTTHSDTRFFIRHYLPRTQLIIAGQGPILLALAQLTLISGFDCVIFCDERRTQAELDEHDLPYRPVKNALIELDQYSAFISLFHEHEVEYSLLAHALAQPTFYIGALGSRHTHQQRLKALTQQGFSEKALDKIHGPVGIDIHAKQPQHIAVSIIADIIRHLPECP